MKQNWVEMDIFLFLVLASHGNLSRWTFIRDVTWFFFIESPSRFHFLKRTSNLMFCRELFFSPITFLFDVISEYALKRIFISRQNIHLNNFDKNFIFFQLQNSITFMKMIEQQTVDKFDGLVVSCGEDKGVLRYINNFRDFSKYSEK